MSWNKGKREKRTLNMPKMGTLQDDIRLRQTCADVEFPICSSLPTSQSSSKTREKVDGKSA